MTKEADGGILSLGTTISKIASISFRCVLFVNPKKPEVLEERITRKNDTVIFDT